MNILNLIASILLVLGALNWGTYGLANVDLVENFLGGKKSPLGKAVYVLIGLAGIYSIIYSIIG